MNGHRRPLDASKYVGEYEYHEQSARPLEYIAEPITALFPVKFIDTCNK